MLSNDDRALRAVRNRALFRGANEKILGLNEVFADLVGSFAIACECARIDCVALLEIPPDAYRAIRASPRTFAVLPEHVDARVEHVVETHAGYAVVEAMGAVAAVAQATPARRDEAAA